MIQSSSAAPPMDLQVTKKMLRALAPLPDTAMHLLTLLNDPNVSLRRVADLAARDVGISASLLRMANSALFGLRGSVGSIADAVRIIGTAQVRLLVLASGVSWAAQKELALYGLPAGAFMRHSELVANLTMTLAHDRRCTSIGVAYSAGLLHDIGKVILNGVAQQHMPGKKVSLEEQIAEQSCTLWAAEVALFGSNHADVGRQLAEIWSLPVELGDALALHHEANLDDDVQPLAVCVNIANSVASTVDPEYPALNRATAITPPAWVNMDQLFSMARHCGFEVARTA